MPSFQCQSPKQVHVCQGSGMMALGAPRSTSQVMAPRCCSLRILPNMTALFWPWFWAMLRL